MRGDKHLILQLGWCKNQELMLYFHTIFRVLLLGVRARCALQLGWYRHQELILLNTIFCVTTSTTGTSVVGLLLGVKTRGDKHLTLQLGWCKNQELVDMLHTDFSVIISSTVVSAVGLLLGARVRAEQCALQLSWCSIQGLAVRICCSLLCVL